MCNGEVQPLPPMALGQNWLFPLHNSFYTSFLQSPMNWFRGKMLVLDVLKGFGDFHSILSISGADKMLSIASIHRSKLGWVTTKGLLKVRMLSEANSGYGRMMYTSYISD